MKEAVCVLLPFKDGYISVSRRNDDSKWGLPGGKVDAGETPVEAVVRELHEEIGLRLDQDSMSAVLCLTCYGDDGQQYLATTYIYNGNPTVESVDSLKPEKGLKISVLTESQLCDPDISPFAEYNAQVFKSIN